MRICEPVCILLLRYGLEKIQNKFKCVYVCLSLKKCNASNYHDSHNECIETSDLQSSITHLAIIYILQQDIQQDIGYINSAIYSCYIKYYGQKSNVLLVNYNSMRLISTITSNAGLTQLFIYNNRINQSVFTKYYISESVRVLCHVFTLMKKAYTYILLTEVVFFSILYQFIKQDRLL